MSANTTPVDRHQPRRARHTSHAAGPFISSRRTIALAAAAACVASMALTHAPLAHAQAAATQAPAMKAPAAQAPPARPTAGRAQPARQTPATAPLEAIRYTLTFPAPQTHYVEVEASVPTGKKPAVELMMAVWTPGSYLVREYERNVENLSAQNPDGGALAVAKSRKNRWRIETGGAARVTVRYRVYSREMSVRNNWVDSRFALLNGAQTYLTLVEPRAARPHEVTLELPATWKTSVTGLPDAVDRRAHHYVAPDYDTLVDSPIVAGNPTVHVFEVSGKKHYLVNEGEAGVFDGARALPDVEKIVRANEKLWGELPYDKYVFFNLLVGGGGGVEHKNSTVMMANRFSMATRGAYVGWLKLVSHEYFHAWNVKRLRPVELGPFDYENEVHTTGLWIAEGVTSYYGDLMVRRAGLESQDDYLADLSGEIRSLQSTPGRLVQPVESASYDAWIKQYRPDENSANTSISYYTKGAVIGLLLDAKIRKATNGAKSLDDGMRLAFTRYGGAKGFTAQEFRKTMEEVAGTSFGTWWQDVLESTKELDYTEALGWFGLQFQPAPAGRPADERGWLGLGTRVDAGRLVVSDVRRGTPGYDAGFNVEDEIIAVNDLRVRPQGATPVSANPWQARMDQYHPGDKVSVLIARRDELMTLDATFGREPQDTWRIQIRPDATADQQQHLAALQSLDPPGAR